MVRFIKLSVILLFIPLCGGCAERDLAQPADGRLCQVGDIRAVTTGPGNDSEAVWSPDGRQIAFQTDRQGDLDLAMVELADGKVSLLVEGVGNACYPAWTPDGALVYAYGNHTGTAVQAASAQADYGYGLRLWRAGQTQVLTQGYWRDYTPSVSPDGSAVIYASTCGETGDGVALWRVSLAAGSRPERLARLEREQGGMVQPSLSPDEKYMLWAQLDDFRQNWRICAARATNLQAIAFLTPNQMGAYAPRWSPDGRWVAFTGFQEGDSGWGIYVMEPRSGAMSRLETGAGDSRSPAWSPDGRELVFENNRSGSYKLYRMRVSCHEQSASPGRKAEALPVNRLEARLERHEGVVNLIDAQGGQVTGTVVPGKEAVTFELPAGFDFGKGAFYVKMTLTVDAFEPGARIAAVGNYAGHPTGWQMYLSAQQHLWFNARNSQGDFVGAQSDEPVTLGQPIQVLGYRDGIGAVRLYVNGKLQRRQGAGADMSYGTALKVSLGQQWNGGMRMNGRALSFECGRGYPAGVSHPITREQLFKDGS